MRLILLRHPEVITVVSQHGRPDDGSDASPFSNVELFAPLKPFDEWPKGVNKEKLTEQLQKEFDDELPGVTSISRSISRTTLRKEISGVKGANSIKIIGPNLETLTKLAGQVRDEMSAGPRGSRSGDLPGPGPAEPQHHGRSRAGGALWPERRGHQLRGAGLDGRRGGDLGAGGRPAVRSGPPLHARISRQHREDP